MKLIPGNMPRDYSALLRRVKEVLIEGQRRIESERVRTYWETGRVIHGHILKHADRAEYGSQVIANIAKDIQVEQTLLKRCVKFAKQYPRLPIGATWHQLSWSHYRQLIAVSDHKQRQLLEKGTAKNAWSVSELSARIRTVKIDPEPAAPVRSMDPRPLLTPQRGELYTYRLVTRPTLGEKEGSGLLIDLGFGFFREVNTRLGEGDMVRSRPTEDAYKFTKVDAAVKELFTYNAFIEKVIDGDTLKVRLDLGFDSWTRQTLRLRGIDSPEVDTKAGVEARTFAQVLIKESQRIIVRTSKSDKYDRYLADVFIPSENGEEVYLNNLLLEKGFARRY